jgi:2,3-bisphosphoglycerate-dependent phosphoglycerate mutase
MTVAPSGPRREAGRVILLRHGQSTFNAANLFTGWADPPLTRQGEREAVLAGAAMAAAGFAPDAAHTSLLRRAEASARLALAAADCEQVPVQHTWRLNGRHYGALQGRDKDLVRREFGTARVQRWRRSYDARPPALRTDPNAADPRYADIPPHLLPHAESLRDVSARLLPYWFDVVVPQLCEGRTVLVVAHCNTLRALIKHLDEISDDEITRLEVPTGLPLLYRLDLRMRPLAPGGEALGRGPRSTAAAARALDAGP